VVRVVILLGVGLASIDRTAYPRFKRVVSARELTEAFTPTSDEVAWARGKSHSDPHLLALAVRLKAYQRLGYFPKLPASGYAGARPFLPYSGPTPARNARKSLQRLRSRMR
jgi:hypothetical protein